MASQNQQETYNEDDRSTNTTLNSSANCIIKNCLNVNQTTKDNEKYRKGEARKRSFIEIGKEKRGRSIDLNLHLTPPRMDLHHQKDHLSSNRCSEMSSASSCMPLNRDSSSEEVEFGNKILDEPSLILMGCSRCLIYVMVSEINPRCPNCHNSNLIDIFRSRFGKKSRNC